MNIGLGGGTGLHSERQNAQSETRRLLPTQVWGWIVIGLAFASQAVALASPAAVDGVVDLRGWDLTSQGPVGLNGTWLFTPGRFTVPGSAVQVGASSVTTVPAVVPDPWNAYRGDTADSHFPALGYGTFHLTVMLARRYSELNIELSGICTSYSCYVDGRLIATSGQISVIPAGQIPMVTDQIAPFAPASNRIELDIEVTNFVHRVGGLTHPVYLGTGRDLSERHASARGIDFLLIGAFLVMGLYHLGLFVLRRQERSLLYFGIFCLITVLRIYVTGGYSSPPFHGLLSWQWLMRVEYFTLSVGFPVFVLYVHSLYRKEFDQRVRDIALILSGLYTLVVVITPALVFGRMLIGFQILIIITSGYLFWVLARALRRRRSSTRIFLAGFALFFLGVLNDILVNNRLINTPYIFPIALFVFILFQAVLLAGRFARVYRQVESLTRLHGQLRAANQNLRELSYVDSLTAVANRRHFDEFVRQEWARSIRNNTPLSLLMIDIDSFKAYNDNYGHRAGDEALRNVAAELSRVVRRSVDFLARYGGEEFVVVLPNTAAKGAFRVAEKLRSGIQALHIPHLYSGVSSVLTISIGVATEQPREHAAAGNLVDTADRALYRAKQRGKNCVAGL
ncbi:MAG TPA: diguanylate cyclase [Spirochaetia bacterium]|nr:diguanylate cyclase [Spirochaetia bacterium]